MARPCRRSPRRRSRRAPWRPTTSPSTVRQEIRARSLRGADAVAARRTCAAGQEIDVPGRPPRGPGGERVERLHEVLARVVAEEALDDVLATARRRRRSGPSTAPGCRARRSPTRARPRGPRLPCRVRRRRCRRRCRRPGLPASSTAAARARRPAPTAPAAPARCRHAHHVAHPSSRGRPTRASTDSPPPRSSRGVVPGQGTAVPVGSGSCRSRQRRCLTISETRWPPEIALAELGIATRPVEGQGRLVSRH